MKAFLTGGSGFLGGALLAGLRERGDEVVALARSDEAAAKLSAAGAQVVRGHTLDEDALVGGMQGCDIVYHVAGINTMCPDDPVEMIHVNVRGAEMAVRATGRAGIERLVLTSSAAALGEERGTIGTEDSRHRGWYMSVYERSKHEGEVAALAAAGPAGVQVVSVNPSSVQGPGRAGGTGRIMIAYLNGRLRAFVRTNITIVDIRDCVRGHLLAADKGVPGDRYVLSGGTLTSAEALEIVADMTGVKERPRFLPPVVASGVATLAESGFKLARKHPPFCRAMVKTLLHGHRYDGSKAARELGLEYTPVRDTFARTVQWALDEGLVDRPLPAWPPD